MQYIARDCGQHFGPQRENGDNRCTKCAYNAKLNAKCARHELPHESMRKFVAAVSR